MLKKFNASVHRCGTSRDPARYTIHRYSKCCNLQVDESTHQRATHDGHPTNTTALASKQNQRPAIPLPLRCKLEVVQFERIQHSR
jgi:hypothetical protein